VNPNLRLLQLILLFSLFLSVACGGLSSKQKDAAKDALKALRKIEAATQVGVSYMQYGPLVIDAQAQVNEAMSMLPDGELKKELKAAMEAYADAGQAWEKTINGRLQGSSLGDSLDKKYSLGLPSKDEYVYEKAMREVVLSKIWAAGREHIERASSLLEKV
jgi:hypothetical protein